MMYLPLVWAFLFSLRTEGGSLACLGVFSFSSLFSFLGKIYLKQSMYASRKGDCRNIPPCIYLERLANATTTAISTDELTRRSRMNKFHHLHDHSKIFKPTYDQLRGENLSFASPSLGVCGLQCASTPCWRSNTVPSKYIDDLPRATTAIYLSWPVSHLEIFCRLLARKAPVGG